jgi:hypothetical protein
VHILKELVIFPNSHAKSDQGVIAAHNYHLGNVLILATMYLGQSATFRFSALEMARRMDPFQELGDSRGDA